MRKLFLCTLLSSCAFDQPPPPWETHMLQRCNANLLKTAASIYPAPPVWTDTKFDGGTKAELLAKLSDKQRASFEADLVAFNQRYLGVLQDWAHEELTLGGGSRMFSQSLLTYRTEVRGPDGQVCEAFRNTIDPGGGYGPGDRIRGIGSLTGLSSAQFIRARRTSAN